MFKRAIIALILLGPLTYVTPSAAICFLAEKEDTVICEMDPEETCCVIEYYVDGLRCIEGWCASGTLCVWEQLVGTLCMGPGLDIDHDILDAMSFTR